MIGLYSYTSDMAQPLFSLFGVSKFMFDIVYIEYAVLYR